MAYAVVLAGAVALFVKAQIASGFSVLLSDRYDGFIQCAILEHWRNVWAGVEPWRTAIYFYPYKGTLGYNDGFFLYGLPYSLFRWAGLDPFLANELTTVTIRATAFVGAELFLRTALRMPWTWSLLGAVVFTISCNASLQAHHGQLLSIAFAPWFALPLWRAASAFGRAAWRLAVLWAGAACVLMGAWLMTAFYMAWFTLFFTLCLALLAAAWRRRQALAYARALPRAGWGALAVVALLAVACAVPFLRVYLPTSRETGGHGFEEVRFYLPQPLDVTFIGNGNPLLSWMDAAVEGALRPDEPRFSERTAGLTWLLLLVFLAALPWLWRRRKEERTWPVLLLGAAAVLTWACTLVIHKQTLWRMIYAGVPGARGLRVVVRYNLFLAAPVIAVAVFYLSRLRAPGVVLAIVAGLLVAEQVTFNEPLGLIRSAELALLASVPPAPAGCRSFFVTAARPGRYMSEPIDGLYSHNVDAMLLAELTRLPTINGFSTFTPPDWNFNNPGYPVYRRRVQLYAAAHNLMGVCGLDLTAMRWDTAPFAEVGG